MAEDVAYESFCFYSTLAFILWLPITNNICSQPVCFYNKIYAWHTDWKNEALDILKCKTTTLRKI